MKTPTCMHREVRGGNRQSLFCKKPEGHEGNHYHDVHPGGARYDAANRIWVYGEDLPVTHYITVEMTREEMARVVRFMGGATFEENIQQFVRNEVEQALRQLADDDARGLLSK